MSLLLWLGLVLPVLLQLFSFLPFLWHLLLLGLLLLLSLPWLRLLPLLCLCLSLLLLTLCPRLHLLLLLRIFPARLPLRPLLYVRAAAWQRGASHHTSLCTVLVLLVLHCAALSRLLLLPLL